MIKNKANCDFCGIEFSLTDYSGKKVIIQEQPYIVDEKGTLIVLEKAKKELLHNLFELDLCTDCIGTLKHLVKSRLDCAKPEQVAIQINRVVGRKLVPSTVKFDSGKFLNGLEDLKFNKEK